MVVTYLDTLVGGVSKSFLQLRESHLRELLLGPLRSVSKIPNPDKTLVEARQAQKTPDMFYRSRGEPVSDGCNLALSGWNLIPSRFTRYPQNSISR